MKRGSALGRLTMGRMGRTTVRPVGNFLSGIGAFLALLAHLCSDLVAALAGLDVDDLPHDEDEVELEEEADKDKSGGVRLVRGFGDE